MKKIKVTMYFPSNKITAPVTYHLIKDYNLMLNILNADVSLNKIGTLVVDIEGEEKDIEAGLEFVKSQGADYKVFSKSIIWQEESCVHCGACTAVCPSGALTMDKTDWNLTFDKEKCLVCELCVKACPLKVMCVRNGDKA
ncbi:MAG TPA: 4Fe-4S binding protein [Clostridiales bacterium]|nr:4Fe-4S binding protein [Clostridiales bacterium]